MPMPSFYSGLQTLSYISVFTDHNETYSYQLQSNHGQITKCRSAAQYNPHHHCILYNTEIKQRHANTTAYPQTHLRAQTEKERTPFVLFSTAFSNIVRAEGRAKEAMMGMMLGTILNIILDPIFILGLDMGVTGAAIADRMSVV